MKHVWLAGAASLALVASFGPAMAQTAQTQEEKQKTEQMAPRGMPKAQQGEAPKSAQEAPKSAQTEQQQKINGEAEKGTKGEASTPRQAAEPSRTPETNQRAQTEQQKNEEQKNDQRAQTEQKNDQGAQGEQKNDQRSAEQSKESTGQRNTQRTGAAERGEPHIIGNMHTSAEHASRVTEMLRTTGHEENANININVGVRVPGNVAIYPVPQDVLAVAPEYRGYSYFIDNGEVVFVSPQSHEIVGAIAYNGGPSGGQMAAGEATQMSGARPCPAQD